MKETWNTQLKSTDREERKKRGKTLEVENTGCKDCRT